MDLMPMESCCLVSSNRVYFQCYKMIVVIKQSVLPPAFYFLALHIDLFLTFHMNVMIQHSQFYYSFCRWLLRFTIIFWVDSCYSIVLFFLLQNSILLYKIHLFNLCSHKLTDIWVTMLFGVLKNRIINIIHYVWIHYVIELCDRIIGSHNKFLFTF